MPDSLLEWVRLLNIIIAGLALVVNVAKAYLLKLFLHMPIDAIMGFIAISAWCVAYSSATSTAWASGLPAGIWTLIMAIPCWWTLIAGFMGWKNRVRNYDSRLTSGVVSANEFRQMRGIWPPKEE